MKSVNLSDDRLKEMTEIKQQNQKILDDIDAKTAALQKAKNIFETYKVSEEGKLNSARALLARETENNRPLAESQALIETLTAQNAELKDQASKLTAQVETLTAQNAELLKK